MCYTIGMNFYVYAYLKEDGSPFYIGKGTGKRIDWKWGRSFDIPPEDRRVVLFNNLTEEAALEREQAVIALLGKDNLINKTSGGQGTSGLRFNQSEEWCEMMSHRFTGENNPFYGKTHNDESKARMRAAARNRHLTTYAEKQRQTGRAWKFIDPTGVLVEFTGSLNYFCKERGLNTGAMSQLNQGKVSHHKGWKKA